MLRYMLTRRLLLLLPLVATAATKPTALDRYVAAPDPSYKYSVVREIADTGLKAVVLDMTSQNWRKPEEISRTEWRHWVTVIRPENVRSTTGFLFIGGGNNLSKPPERIDPMLGRIAREAGIVVAELRMVPNQPLSFPGDTMKQRTEDEFIAYTWDKFLRGGDETWLARLPMTKAAVRALDTMTSFSKSADGGGLTVDKFIVAGGSKRGWTTWTTAAVDKRVIAIAPLVIDMLNVEPSFVHHWRAYGFWSPAIKDYTDMQITEWAGSPEYRALMKIVEPYEYRDRLTLPKMIINAGGDEFFLPDSSQFYFDDLKGESHLRYVPNTGHSLRNSDAPDTLLAFIEMVVASKPRPRYSFRVDKAAGRIHVKTIDRPAEVRIWQATNPNARDFRFKISGAEYVSAPLAEERAGLYVASIPKPEKGWTAAFVELTYPGAGNVPLKVTSGVLVTPDVYPFPAPKPKKPVASP
jgi:PhoPQ-activated pathogenicity-related protein